VNIQKQLFTFKKIFRLRELIFLFKGKILVENYHTSKYEQDTTIQLKWYAVLSRLS